MNDFVRVLDYLDLERLAELIARAIAERMAELVAAPELLAWTSSRASSASAPIWSLSMPTISVRSGLARGCALRSPTRSHGPSATLKWARAEAGFAAIRPCTKGRVGVRLRCVVNTADPKRGIRLAPTRAEAATSLGVSVDFFDEHIAPDLRAIRRGQLRLYPISQLERWLDDNAARALGMSHPIERAAHLPAPSASARPSPNSRSRPCGR
jgi:hypothetical protein